MSDTFSVEVHYGITYHTSNPVPIPEIVKSLQSLENLLKRMPAFVEMAYKDIKIVETQIFVSKIESGSLIEDFVVKFVFKGRENYDAAKQVFEKIMIDNTAIRTVVAMGMGGLLTFGVMQAIPSGAPTTHIEAYDSTVINVGGSVNVTADDFRAVLDSIKDKKSVAKDAIGAIRPAKLDAGSSISISGMSELDISKEVLKEAPDHYEPAEPSEREVHYKAVELIIYASDRDKSDGGWAGIIPEVVSKRTPLILGAGVNPAKLHGRLKVLADVIVWERYNPNKKTYEAKKIEILATN